MAPPNLPQKVGVEDIRMQAQEPTEEGEFDDTQDSMIAESLSSISKRCTI